MKVAAKIFVLALSLSLLGQIDIAAGERKASPNSWTTLPFRSWTTLRTRNVVLQRLDFSCGAASIATIATFYMGRPVTEQQALLIVRARYTDAEWKVKQRDGLSLEDLSYIAARIGLEAQGGRISLAGLLQLNGPVIVHLRKSKDLQHFSVLRGIDGMTVYLADPFSGTVPMSLGDFISQFSGAVLAVWDPAKPLPLEYRLKLREQDSYYDQTYRAVRPSLYDRPRPMGPGF